MSTKTQPRLANGRFGVIHGKRSGKRKPKAKKPANTGFESKKITPSTVPISSFIGLVIDSSGSMAAHKERTEVALNEQVETIRAESAQTGVPTRVSVISFDNRVHPTVHYGVQPDAVGKLTIKLGGMTALFEAIWEMIKTLESQSGSAQNPSYLINVFTDGLENASGAWVKANLKSEIDRRLKTDRWTIAINGPEGCKQEFERLLGIGVQNVNEWKTDRVGTVAMSVSNAAGVSGYLRSASKGVASVAKGGFFPNLAGLNTANVKGNLDDVTNSYLTFRVRNDQRIDDFVNSQGQTYIPGRAYYQLNKKVKVQGYKEIVIREKNTGKLYTGDKIRDLLNLPSGGTIDLNPSFHPRWDVFILSTSLNRKLARGTDVLFLV